MAHSSADLITKFFRDNFQKDYTVIAVPQPFSINVFDLSHWSASTSGHYITTYDTIGATYTPTPATEVNLNRLDNDVAWTV